MIIKKKNSQS